MIAAGVPILYEYDERFSNQSDIVAKIFEAMAVKGGYAKRASPEIS
jgi:hypothetical protein